MLMMMMMMMMMQGGYSNPILYTSAPLCAFPFFFDRLAVRLLRLVQTKGVLFAVMMNGWSGGRIGY